MKSMKTLLGFSGEKEKLLVYLKLVSSDGVGIYLNL